MPCSSRAWAKGGTSDASLSLDLPGDEVGLVNPFQAEILLVVRMHGPPIPGMVAEQIRTYNGGSCIGLTFDNNPDDGYVDLEFARHAPPRYGGTSARGSLCVRGASTGSTGHHATATSRSQTEGALAMVVPDGYARADSSHLI
jgi:hypothetical protein